MLQIGKASVRCFVLTTKVAGVDFLTVGATPKV